MLNAEAEEGDATALGLATELEKPKFVITLYFLSDVPDTLSALSKTFQAGDLNLLHIEQLVTTHITTLQELKEDPYVVGSCCSISTMIFPPKQRLLTSLILRLQHRNILIA